MSKPIIEFIKYTGDYPTLCMGDLFIKVNGKEYKIHGLCSGGSVWFDEDWTDHVEEGKWSLYEHNVPKEIIKYIPEIEELVNANVPLGCCGGCV